MRYNLPYALGGQKIGLLGGSFDPAHEGHIHITKEAMKNFHLDAVWWLISPRNPLKKKKPEAVRDRKTNAELLLKDANTFVTDLEFQLKTQYTYEIILQLKRLYWGVSFVWIMGADNLKQISRWHRWTRIFNQDPIAVFDRAPYSFGALAGKAAKAFCRFKRKRSDACNLPDMAPPAWMFFHTQLHPGSATNIRAHKSRGESSSAKKMERPECE